MRTVALLALCALLRAQSASSSCAESVFRGFDSRLSLRPIGKLLEAAEPPIGFETINGRAIVAFPHRILALRGETVAAVPSLDAISGIAVDSSGALRLQTNKGIQMLGAERFEADAALTRTVNGHLLGSGEDALLEVTRTKEDTRFMLITARGGLLPLFHTTGNFRIGSWNALGLAAVIDNRLVVWENGAAQLTVLAIDRGLEEARDVVLVGQRRAVVSLGHSTILITPNHRIVLFGSSTRCRFASGLLSLLDLQSGIVWSVEGIDRVGDARDDEDHARSLISGLPEGAPESSPQFMEAARIVGCGQARAWR